MKKFEDKFNENISLIKTALGDVCSVTHVKAVFKDWVSPEDHQAEIAKLNSKIDWLHGLLDERNEEVLQTVKLLNEATPEIPEVPKFVADWYEENKHSLDYMIFETCRDLTDESTDEFENWFGYDENKAITTLVNMKNGYTVSKEKRFYLKHIDMSKKYNSTVCVLAHGEGDVIYGHYEFPVGVFPSESDYIFTQSQIDSMETGSYEQIEVTE